jgi:hypothetical protein
VQGMSSSLKLSTLPDENIISMSADTIISVCLSISLILPV